MTPKTKLTLRFPIFNESLRMDGSSVQWRDFRGVIGTDFGVVPIG